MNYIILDIIAICLLFAVGIIVKKQNKEEK